MMKSIPRSKLIVAIIAAAAVAGGAYAFTAANTVPASKAGAGSGAVSGYTITNLHYNLNATAPGDIDSLTFNISPVVPSTSTGKVTIQATLSSGGPYTYACATDSSGATATCATTSPSQLTIGLLNSLTVVAAQ
jgi:hypothetical protein